ncbi:MAG: cell division protein SepF [Clostridium sp.]
MSSNAFEKVKTFLGFGDEYDEDFENEDFEDVEESQEERKEEKIEPVISNGGKASKNNNKVVNIHTSASAKVTITKPTVYDEAQDICDAVKNRRIVLINTTALEIRTAQRLLDFVSGCCYALGGELQEIEKGVYILSPSNVEVTNELKTELNSKVLFNWSSK